MLLPLARRQSNRQKREGEARGLGDGLSYCCEPAAVWLVGAPDWIGFTTAEQRDAVVDVGAISRSTLSSTTALTFDPATENVVDDAEAATLLGRTYRKDGHWGVPTDS